MCIDSDSSPEVCPLLRTVISKGNITTYEWRTGTAPNSIIDTALHSQALQDTDPVPDQAGDEVNNSAAEILQNRLVQIEARERHVTLFKTFS